jgi:DNA-binding CsgD family transcriptional regulator
METVPILLLVRSRIFLAGLQDALRYTRFSFSTPPRFTAYHSDFPQWERGGRCIILTVSEDLDVAATVVTPNRLPMVVVARTFLCGLDLIEDPRIQGLLVDIPGNMGRVLDLHLEAVVRGDRVVQSALSAPLSSLLSPQEAQVVVLAAQGLSLKEISGRLELSRSSVSSYRDRAIARLGLSDLTAGSARKALHEWWQSLGLQPSFRHQVATVTAATAAWPPPILQPTTTTPSHP